MKKVFVVLSFIALFISFGRIMAVETDSPDDVIFVNTGLMNIKAGGTNGVAMYVPFAMRHTGSDASIVLNGEVNVGGNFYQDAQTTVFKIDDTSTTSATYSTGNFRFVKNWSEPRVISSNFIETTYDRGQSYIAFPNIRLATNDTFGISAKMGIDALTLKRETGFTGKFVLESDRYVDDVFDASLRITGEGNSDDLVDIGSVIVEREMSYYRSISGVDKLFGFATPFHNTQLSGYFAGNWVRRPVADPVTGHTRYVFGNEQDEFGVILASQYIYHPEEKLKSGQAYLIKPRPAGFNYADLMAENGLSVTDGDTTAYDQNKFVFNGNVYLLYGYDEQLFAQDTVFKSPSVTSTTSTINWLVGNSYTAPIGTKQLIDAMGASPLKFSPYIWVYPAGSSTYQSYKITGTDNIIVQDLEEIPAMSVFMIRVLSGTSPGQFNITKDMQRHAKVTHSAPANAPSMARSAKAKTAGISNQVLFKVTPSDNIWNYDLAAIGLRSGANLGSDSYDMTKIYSEADVFQLYTLSSTDAKLSANAVPLETPSVKLCFRPVKDTTEFQLEAQHLETLSSEGLWLEDLVTRTITDMYEQPCYSFISIPDDVEERFIVHFVAPENTGLVDGELSSGIKAFMLNDNLIVKNLLVDDLGAIVHLYDASGRLLKMHTVNSYPTVEIPFKTMSGVYMLQLRGDRTDSAKFIVK
jgi:hypothetical protein